MSHYPLPESLTHEPFEFKTYRSIYSMLSGLFLFVVLIFVVYLVVAGWLRSAPSGAGFPLWLRALSLIPALVLLNLVRLYLNDLYVFNNKCVTNYHGRLWWNYEVPVVDYADIREILVAQGVLGRLLNYGDLSVGTAAVSNMEICMKGVPAPHKLQQLLERLRQLRVEKIKEEHEHKGE